MITRKLAALAVLFFITANLSFFLGGRPFAGDEAITIVLGFILVGSFFVAKVFARMRLPMLTGYLVFGMAAGPAAAGVITKAHIAQFSFINSLAFAYIALSAGNEIEWDFLRKKWGAIAAIGLVNIAVVFLGVALVLYYLLLDGFASAAAIPPLLIPSAAMVMAAVAASTSPAVTVAIVNEAESKGTLTETAMGVVVISDIVIITLFTVVMSWTLELSGGGAAISTKNLISSIVMEVGAALFAGALIGIAVLVYLKTVGERMLLFVFGVAVISTAVASQYHLNELLICATTGFMVRNFSAAGRKFLRATEKGALPIFIVFFSLAGASLDMGALRAMWTVALFYFALRLALMWGATSATVRVVDLPQKTRQWLWGAFVSQAGVSLGLALKVRDHFPVAGGILATLIIAEISICEIIGPVIFKRALVETGEVGKREKTTRFSSKDMRGLSPAE